MLITQMEMEGVVVETMVKEDQIAMEEEEVYFSQMSIMRSNSIILSHNSTIHCF